MKLFQRYKKLNFWNKLAFLGALASIIGLVFIFTKKESINITKSPGAITQIMKDSPNSTQIAGDYIIKNEPRIISKETIKQMQPALKALPAFTAEIKVPLGDSESFELGEQLKEILQKANWKIDKVWPVIADPPIKRGIKLYFGHRPNGVLQAVFAPIFEQFGYERVANFDKNMSPEVIRIYIGSK
ncbi:hypothetical protein KAI19_00280 [bacterium]|nr:hypothetical protein [bacterium]